MNRPILLLLALSLAALACGSGAQQATSIQSPGAQGAEASTPKGPEPRSRDTPIGAEPKGTSSAVPSQPTAAASPTSRPTSAPGATPAGERPEIEVIDSNVTGSESDFSIVGLVRNNGDQFIANVNITFFIRNASGEVVETLFGGLEMMTLPPGEMTPFKIEFPSGVPPDLATLEPEVRVRYAEPSFAWTRDGFEIASVEAAMGQYNYEVTGEIRNAGNLDSPFATIYCLAFNAEGRYIGDRFTYVEDLAAGGTATFHIAFSVDSLAEPLPPASIQLLAEGYRVAQ